VNFRRSVIIVKLWRPVKSQYLEILREIFAFFLQKTTPYGKILKILIQKFSLPYRSMLCSNVVKFVQQEIGEIVRYLPDQKNKISVASQTVATVRIAPKICQGQPQ